MCFLFLSAEIFQCVLFLLIWHRITSTWLIDWRLTDTCLQVFRSTLHPPDYQSRLEIVRANSKTSLNQTSTSSKTGTLQVSVIKVFFMFLKFRVVLQELRFLLSIFHLFSWNSSFIILLLFTLSDLLLLINHWYIYAEKLPVIGAVATFSSFISLLLNYCNVCPVLPEFQQMIGRISCDSFVLAQFLNHWTCLYSVNNELYYILWVQAEKTWLITLNQ